MKPSKFHSNRKLHNWLIYNNSDYFLEKYKDFYKGDMYDLGCGETPYRDYFLQYANSYTGVDWGETLHDLKADVVANLNEPIDIEDNKADSIVSLATLEHLSEPQTMLNEAFRILKPGGTIMLQTPWQWKIHEAPYDFFRYSPYALEYMLGKAGFTDVKVEAQSGFFTTLFIKLTYFLSRLVRGPKLLRFVISVILAPLMFILQALAPLLDKLDNNWPLESFAYVTTARKP